MFNGIRLQVSVLLILLSCFTSLRAQETDLKSISSANEMLIKRGEVIIRFVKPSTMQVSEISRHLSIDDYRNDTLTAYAGDQGFSWFRKLGIPFEILTAPSLDTTRFRRNRAVEKKDLVNDYPSYSQYVARMNAFAADFPEICVLRDFGPSTGGHRLLAVKISDNPSEKEKEPVVLYTSTMHGDEPLGYVLMLKLADYLLTAYSVDPDIRELVDRTEIWINPLANPDGAYFLSDSSLEGAIRFNLNQVDLNRDFPEIPVDNTIEKQQETRMMMDFMKDIRPALAANFHGGAEVINYPWDTWETRHPDDSWYRRISHAYADTVHSHAPEGYMTFMNNGITRGIEWYVVYGGRQDYVNYYLSGREVTVELSDDKIPPADELESYWNYNHKSLIQFIRQSFTGFTGTITDSASGQPLEARIRILNYDYDNSFVYSRSDNGNYYRLTREGTYNVIISSPGHRYKRAQVTVNPGELTQLDMILSSEFSMDLSPNPFDDYLRFDIPYSGYNLTLTFIDLLGRKVKIIRKPIIYAGKQDIPIDGLVPGYYVLFVEYNDVTWKFTCLKQNR